MTELVRGAVVWADLDPTLGREQSGRRPAVVVASNEYLERATHLAIVVPVTSMDRDWPNHVRLQGETGLSRSSFAITEQPRTIDRSRIRAKIGHVDSGTLAAIDVWLSDFLDLSTRRETP